MKHGLIAIFVLVVSNVFAQTIELPTFAKDVSVWKNRSGGTTDGTGPGNLRNAIDPWRSSAGSQACPFRLSRFSDLTTWEPDSSTWQQNAQGAYDAVGPYKPLAGNSWMMFDLGSTKTNLAKIYMWNTVESALRGIGDFNLYYATSPASLPAAWAKSNTLSTTPTEYDFSAGGWTVHGATHTMGSVIGGVYDLVLDVSSVPAARYFGIEILTNKGEIGAAVNNGYRAELNCLVFTETLPSMEWTGHGGNLVGVWQDGANWNPGVVTDRDVEIDAEGSSVRVDGSATAPRVIVGQNNVARLEIKQGSTLTVTDTAEHGTNLALGLCINAKGTLDVDGAVVATVLNNSGDLILSSTADMSGVSLLRLLYGGSMKLGKDDACGSGSLVLQYSKISSDSSIARTVGNPVDMQSLRSGDFVFGDIVDTGKLTFTNTVTFGYYEAKLVTISDVEISGILTSSSNNQGLMKHGPGTLTLSGASTLALYWMMYGGQLVLDYSSENNRKLANNLILYGYGGELTLKNGTFGEIFNGITLGNGGTLLTRSGSSTGTFTLKAITRQAGGTIDMQDASIASTTSANTNGILGGYATVAGADWAVAGAPITALASYTGPLPTSVGAATDNYTLTGSQTQAGATLANTIKIANSGSSESLDLGANDLTVRYTSASSLGGILYVGGGDNNYTITGSGGKMLTTSTTGELIINVNTGTLTINTPFVTTGGTAGTLTKTGPGTLVADTTNAYTSWTYVNEGVLRLRNNTAAGAAGNYGVYVETGACLELDNNITVGGEKTFLGGFGVTNSGAMRNLAGNSCSFAGQINVEYGGARINSDAGATLTLSGGIVTALGKDIVFGGAGDIVVQTTAVSGAGNLIKDGAGTLTLSSTPTYSGDTIVSEGTLSVNAANVSNDSSTVTISDTAILNLNFIGTETVGYLVIGSTEMEPGVYGSGEISTPRITGSGTLTVLCGPPPPPPAGTLFIIK